MTLTLAPDTEARLLAAAAEKGLAPEEVIDALLRQETPEPAQDTPVQDTPKQARLHAALFQAIAEAQALEPVPPQEEQEQLRLQDVFTQLQTAALALETEPAPLKADLALEEIMFGEIITEKYRKQGFNLP